MSCIGKRGWWYSVRSSNFVFHRGIFVQRFAGSACLATLLRILIFHRVIIVSHTYALTAPRLEQETVSVSSIASSSSSSSTNKSACPLGKEEKKKIIESRDRG